MFFELTNVYRRGFDDFIARIYHWCVFTVDIEVVDMTIDASFCGFEFDMFITWCLHGISRHGWGCFHVFYEVINLSPLIPAISWERRVLFSSFVEWSSMMQFLSSCSFSLDQMLLLARWSRILVEVEKVPFATQNQGNDSPLPSWWLVLSIRCSTCGPIGFV